MYELAVCVYIEAVQTNNVLCDGQVHSARNKDCAADAYCTSWIKDVFPGYVGEKFATLKMHVLKSNGYSGRDTRFLWLSRWSAWDFLWYIGCLAVVLLVYIHRLTTLSWQGLS